MTEHQKIEALGHTLEQIGRSFVWTDPSGNYRTFASRDFDTALNSLVLSYAACKDVIEFVHAARGWDFPTRSELETLKVGDYAVSRFGQIAEVVSVETRAEDQYGRLYVVYCTPTLGGKTISVLRQQDTLTRTTAVRASYTPAELDAIEARLQRSRFTNSPWLTTEKSRAHGLC